MIKHNYNCNISYYVRIQWRLFFFKVLQMNSSEANSEGHLRTMGGPMPVGLCRIPT